MVRLWGEKRFCHENASRARENKTAKDVFCNKTLSSLAISEEKEEIQIIKVEVRVPSLYQSFVTVKTCRLQQIRERKSMGEICIMFGVDKRSTLHFLVPDGGWIDGEKKS